MRGMNHTRLAYAVAARDTADHARSLIGDLSTPLHVGDRIRAARQLRIHALTVLDRAVLIERADGASWDPHRDGVRRPC